MRYRILGAVLTLFCWLVLALCVAKIAQAAVLPEKDFTDPNLFIPKNQTWYVSIETIEAVVTKYSKDETCPNRVCHAANGEEPVPGRTGACPRNVSFGSKFSLQGVRQTWLRCNDRTSLRYNGRFDVFAKDYEEAIKWGKHKTQVTLEYGTPVSRLR